jgi:hypothetical protein
MSSFKIYNITVDKAVSETLSFIENGGIVTNGWGLSGNVVPQRERQFFIIAGCINI